MGGLEHRQGASKLVRELTYHLHAGWPSEVFQVLKNDVLDSFQVLGIVEVFHIGGSDVEPIVWAKVLVVLVHRDFWTYGSRLSVTCHAREKHVKATHHFRVPRRPRGRFQMPTLD